MVFIPRMKINGRKATEEKIITEINDLLKGTSRRPYPLPVAEVARVLGVSVTLESFLFVIGLFTFLALTDIIWIGVIYLQNAKIKPPKGWIGLNIVFVASLWLIIHPGWSLPDSAFLLLLICIIRTIIDYVVYKKLYFISFGTS